MIEELLFGIHQHVALHTPSVGLVQAITGARTKEPKLSQNTLVLQTYVSPSVKSKLASRVRLKKYYKKSNVRIKLLIRSSHFD